MNVLFLSSSLFFFFFLRTHRAWKNRLSLSTLYITMKNVYIKSSQNDLVKKVFIWCVIIASMNGRMV